MIKRFFIFVLEMSLISLLVLSFFLISLFRAYLRPESYNNGKLTEGISELTANIVTQKVFPSFPPASQIFTAEALEKEVQTIISPILIKNLAVSIINQLENYYINPNLEISLIELKNNLAPVVNRLAQEYAAKLPVCETLPAVNEQLPSCRPSMIPADTLGEQITLGINEGMIVSIPAVFSVKKGSNVFLDNFSVVLKNKDKILTLILGLCLLFLLIISALRYPVFYQMLHSYGEIFLMSGFSLITMYICNFLIFNNINRLIQVPADIISFIRLILEPFFDEIYFYSISFLAIGIICYVMFFILKSRTKEVVR